ncbi:TraR/DksA C4-type zinc finger protein [Patescibacteria group bacterium]|nr:TraR/DksA C4-type zinc finger protein [Patescibacteria group bacterium]MBU1673031.1 TraR/DksA C4-type zinc finger protein [Patescibacteria group bacterium]
MEDKTKEDLRKRLLKEKEATEKGLGVISKRDVEDHVPGDFDPKFPNYGDDNYPEMDGVSPGEVADYLVRVYDTGELESRLNDIQAALEKLDGDDNFGYCEKCNESIDNARMQANPAARTCMNCAK